NLKWSLHFCLALRQSLEFELHQRFSTSGGSMRKPALFPLFLVSFWGVTNAMAATFKIDTAWSLGAKKDSHALVRVEEDHTVSIDVKDGRLDLTPSLDKESGAVKIKAELYKNDKLVSQPELVAHLGRSATISEKDNETDKQV